VTLQIGIGSSSAATRRCTKKWLQKSIEFIKGFQIHLLLALDLELVEKSSGSKSWGLTILFCLTL
jgi:hypothetical protein